MDRRHSLIIPREHGAWGILLVPLVTGGAVGLLEGGQALPLAPLTMAVLALFWLRTPVESWVGASPVKASTPEELALVRLSSLALSVAGLAALIWLFWDRQNLELWRIGLASAVAFVAQALVRKRWRSARAAAQLVGAAGLTAVAPAAYYVVTGRLTVAAWTLWVANLLFAANQIHYVQLRIHAARAGRNEKFMLGRTFFAGQIALMAVAGLACAMHDLSWYQAMAFVPLLARGFAWFATDAGPLAVHTLGKRELAHAIIFGVLLVAGFRLG